jgi:1,2-phenylacetyl-CoA epoxidase PaaB subunit
MTQVHYRLYLLDDEDRINAASLEIHAPDDEAAIQAAQDALDRAHAVEIWSGKRRVGIIRH